MLKRDIRNENNRIQEILLSVDVPLTVVGKLMELQ